MASASPSRTGSAPGEAAPLTERAIDRLRPFVGLGSAARRATPIARWVAQAVAMFANAAAGSAKNIVPKRLIITVECTGRELMRLSIALPGIRRCRSARPAVA